MGAVSTRAPTGVPFLHVIIFCTLIPMPVTSYVRTGHGLFGRPVSGGGTMMSAARVVSADDRVTWQPNC